MRSKRSREGELLIDHRASPGLSPADVAGFVGAPAVGKGELYESAVAMCGHCQFAIILEPKRTRERGWCSKCDCYLCDDCTARLQKTLQCRNFRMRADTILNELEHSGTSSLLLLPRSSD